MDSQQWTINAAGVQFNASRSGQRPRLLFLHGFGGDLHTWDAVWQEVAPQVDALRYDLRGFGQSVCVSEEPFSHSEDLLAILDTLELDRVSLCGVSMGGAIALNFALRYPDRLDKLVLISPGMVAWEWSDNWRALWKPLVALARAGDLDKARQRWWQHPLFATTREGDHAQALYQMIMRYSGAQWIRDYERPALPDLERLHTLRIPTLLLTGRRDMEDFRLIADVIESSCDCVTRVDLEEGGHSLPLEYPLWCAQRLLAFLQQK